MPISVRGHTRPTPLSRHIAAAFNPTTIGAGRRPLHRRTARRRRRPVAQRSSSSSELAQRRPLLRRRTSPPPRRAPATDRSGAEPSSRLLCPLDVGTRKVVALEQQRLSRCMAARRVNDAVTEIELSQGDFHVPKLTPSSTSGLNLLQQSRASSWITKIRDKVGPAFLPAPWPSPRGLRDTDRSSREATVNCRHPPVLSARTSCQLD